MHFICKVHENVWLVYNLTISYRRVYIWCPGKWNPDAIPFNDCYAIGYMLCELMALETKTQIAGVTTIVDGGGFGFKQLRNFGIEDARNTAAFIQVQCARD